MFGLAPGAREGSFRYRLRFFLASTWFSVCGSGLPPFATKAEIRAAARQWVYEYWRNEAQACFIRRLKVAKQRYGFRDEATGNIILPITPEVERFLRGETDDAA